MKKITCLLMVISFIFGYFSCCVSAAEGIDLLAYKEAIEHLNNISLTDEVELDLLYRSFAAIGSRYFAPQYKMVTEILLSLNRGDPVEYGVIEAGLKMLSANLAFVADYMSHDSLAFIPFDALLSYATARKMESDGNAQDAYELYTRAQILDSLERGIAQAQVAAEQAATIKAAEEAAVAKAAEEAAAAKAAEEAAAVKAAEEVSAAKAAEEAAAVKAAEEAAAVKAAEEVSAAKAAEEAAAVKAAEEAAAVKAAEEASAAKAAEEVSAAKAAIIEGTKIYFGKYEQDNNIANGKEKITWHVLAVEDGKALLISEDNLDIKAYNTNDNPVTWEISSLRKWLSGDFLNIAFTAEEQQAILLTDIKNDDNLRYHTEGGNNTLDKVFLLSISDMELYFKSNAEMKSLNTVYANAQVAQNIDWYGCWWLRTPGSPMNYAANLSNSGFINEFGSNANSENYAVRPAIWFDLTSDVFISYIKVLSEAEIAAAAARAAIKEGAKISFGKYEQDNDNVNGKEKIEWCVLSVEGDKALLISEKNLEFKQYHISYSSITWEDCSLRKWLNSEFQNAAFTAEEQQAILLMEVKNEDNPTYHTDGGNNTKEKIFLLSIADAEMYFDENENRKALSTAYVLAQGALVNGEYGSWWLRSSGDALGRAAAVGTSGSIIDYGVLVNYAVCAIRPALYIDLASNVMSSIEVIVPNAEPTKTPTAGPEVKPTPTTPPTPKPTIDVSKYSALKIGDDGEDVLNIRKRLYALGFFSSAPTQTEFTQGLTDKIKEFQKANGLKVDGIASPMLQGLLFSSDAVPKPVPTTKLTKPQSVKISASISSVTVSWTAVKGAAEYKIYRSSSSNGTYTLIGTATYNQYTDINISKGYTYYYKVESVSGLNISDSSSYVKAVIPTPSPTPDPRKAYGRLNYEDYARYPDNYTNGKFKILGTVVQVLGSRSSGFQLRVATRGSYSDVVYVYVNFDPYFNILEDDKLTIYCKGDGTITYETVMGASMTIPCFTCDKLEMR
jgi:peptidoglycan hydrolase-like protein with peptidoglycan-binding domain